VVNWS